MHFKFTLTAQTKILLIVLFLVLLLGGGVYYLKNQPGGIGVITPPKMEEIKKTFVPKTASMALTTSVPSAKVGQPFEVVLSYSTTDVAIAAFDAVVSYDPSVLRADEIRVGTVFSTYPRKLIDPEKKRLIVTGVQTDPEQNLASASGRLATLVFTPLKSSTTKLEFTVDGDKYTNMMNKTPKNVLGKAEGITIEVER